MSKDINLNEKQKEAYDCMVKGLNVFITGSGGVGKTYITKMFYSRFNTSRKMGLTSTTGTSALILGGVTLHSFLGIGLGTSEAASLVVKIRGNRKLKSRWSKLDTLIIDEVSMLSPELFDKLEYIARTVRKNERPFGGIQLILTGDFLQLPCVKSLQFCFQSENWDTCIEKTIYLTENIRQADEVFQRCLSNIRIANITPEVISIIEKCIKKNLHNELGIVPTRMYPLNISVENVNNKELDLLSRDGREFLQYTMEVKIFADTFNKSEIIEKYKKNCMAPEVLELCVGCQVMLLYNMDFDKKLVNGSRGVVTGFIDDIPIVKFLNGDERLINFYNWDIEESDVIIARITQIPLRVSYAVSIHKVQGSTLDYVEIDLSDIFEYGQFYVALSRVTSLNGLSILSVNWDKVKAHPMALQYYNNL
jgi:ATP-dependent DNA helicase PIF1